jgi:ribonuclease HI
MRKVLVSVPSTTCNVDLSAALIYRMGDKLQCVMMATGVHTPPEMEQFALQVGLSAAIAVGCQCLVVFSDSALAVESILNLSPCSGQVFSLDACKALCLWFEGDACCTLTLWHTPSRFKWHVHKKAHDVAMSLRISRGPHPWMSQDFKLAILDEEALCEWHSLFKQGSYRGRQFLDLNGPRDKPLKPMTHKGGLWLCHLGHTCPGFTHSCHSITGHTPIGEFHQCFHLDSDFHCWCMWWRQNPVLQTRDHLLHVCSLVKRKHI